MSEPVFEASVRIHADTSTVEREAAQGIKDGLDKAERQAQTRPSGFEARAAQRAQEQAALDARNAAVRAQREKEFQEGQKRHAAEMARLQPVIDLQTESAIAATRSETAGLLGDETARKALQLESVVKGTQAAAETMRLDSQDLLKAASEATGSKQQLLLAMAQQARVSAEKLRAEALLFQREGLPPDPADPRIREQQGIGDFLRAGVAGRSGGLAGLIGSGARIGAIGVAATAAFQALGELQQSLRVTGDEAFTMGGKFRNAGAELLSANFIGAFKALTAEKPAQVVGELSQALAAQKAQADPLILTQDKLLAIYQRGPEVFDQYVDALAGLGKISGSTADGLKEITVEAADQAKFFQIATSAAADYQRAVEAAGSAQARFGPDPNLRGPGANATFQPGQGGVGQVVGQQRTGIPRPIVTNPFENPTFQAGTGGADVAARIRNSIRDRLRSEEERTQFDLQSARIAQKQARAAFEAAKAQAQATGTANGAAAEWERYVSATTAVANAAFAAREATAAAAANAEALGNQVRDAQVGAIADPSARSQAALRAARIEEGQARRRFQEAEKGTKEANEAYAAWRIAQAKTAGIQNDIAETAKQAAEAAQQSARNAEEQRLANNIAKAALSPGIQDDIRFTNAAINYYRGIARNANRTAEEREAARGTVIQLRASLRDLRGGDGGDAGELRQQQIANQIAAAELAGNLPGQRRAAAALVDYWRDQVAQLSGIEKAKAQANLIAAKGRQAQVEATRTELQELRILNRQQAAKLTPGEADDRRAAEALVRFWQRQFREAEGIEKERAKSKLIAAKLALQGDAFGKDGEGTTVFDLLSRTAARFQEFAGDLITADQPFTRESFVSEQAQYFRRGGLQSPDEVFAGPTGFAADFGAFRERQDRLSKIPGGGVEASLDRNTTATDRLTDAINGVTGGIDRNDRRHGLSYGDVQAARGKAMGEFWKARQARQATEAGVGATRAGI